MLAGVSRRLPASAWHRWFSVVGRVSIDEPLDGACCYKQRRAARCRLDRFEVPAIDVVSAYKPFDLGVDFGSDDRLERRFFSGTAGSTGRASQMDSLTSNNRSHVARNSLYVSTSICIFVRSGPGRSCTVFVLPFSFLVKA